MHFSEDEGVGGQHGLILAETSWQRRGLRENSGRDLQPPSPTRSAHFALYSLFVCLSFCLRSSCDSLKSAGGRDVRWIAVRRRGSGPVRQHSGSRFLLRWQVLPRVTEQLAAPPCSAAPTPAAQPLHCSWIRAAEGKHQVSGRNVAAERCGVMESSQKSLSDFIHVCLHRPALYKFILNVL